MKVYTKSFVIGPITLLYDGFVQNATLCFKTLKYKRNTRVCATHMYNLRHHSRSPLDHIHPLSSPRGNHFLEFVVNPSLDFLDTSNLCIRTYV